MADIIAFSVDLEPNKDGTLHGVREAMEWFDRTIPRGTVFATYRIATEMPDLLTELAESHEIGVHVHPQEFDHEHDQLADLSSNRQRELISDTRTAIATAIKEPEKAVCAFRAGRHSASEETLAVLDELGFRVDASVNVTYTEYLPKYLIERPGPFALDSGLIEQPTTFVRPPLFSLVGARAFPERTITATANTLRTDKRGTTGLEALQWVLQNSTVFSFYMHPYDATTHHTELSNNGDTFKRRVETLVGELEGSFRSSSGLSTGSHFDEKPRQSD